jgi:hypothetical protein
MAASATRHRVRSRNRDGRKSVMTNRHGDGKGSGMVRLRTVLPICLLLVFSTAARADTIFYATINSAQEVPTNASTAEGFATFVLNDAMTAFTYMATIFGLDFTGSQTPEPEDNLINAHIHGPAPYGVNAGVIFGFFGTPFNENNPNDVIVNAFATGVGGTISGKWDLPEGNNTTLAAHVNNILAGLTYINFHTVRFTGGEIRGQIGRSRLRASPARGSPGGAPAPPRPPLPAWAGPSRWSACTAG